MLYLSFTFFSFLKQSVSYSEIKNAYGKLSLLVSFAQLYHDLSFVILYSISK